MAVSSCTTSPCAFDRVEPSLLISPGKRPMWAQQISFRCVSADLTKWSRLVLLNWGPLARKCRTVN
jgi:hypothetical protein